MSRLAKSMPFLLLLSVSGGIAPAQTASSPAGDAAQPATTPTLRLQYSKPVKSTLPMLGASMGASMSCTADGTTFFPTYSFPSPSARSVSFSAYGVRSTGSYVESVRYDPTLAADLRRVMPIDVMAVSDSRVVLAVKAVTADEEASGKGVKSHPFLLFFDRKGTFLRSAPIDIDFHIAAIGIFDSGDLLVAGGPSPDERHRHWVVLDDHGRFLRTLNPGTEGDEDRKPGDTTNLAQTLLTGHPQLVPYRGHLLLLESNTPYPIKEINEGGEINSTSLNLPKGDSPWQLLPSDGPHWIVVLGRMNDAAAEGLPVGGFNADKIAEFDPATGDLIRYIVPGPNHYPSSLSCQHDGVFTALSTDPKDGSLILETASLEN